MDALRAPLLKAAAGGRPALEAALLSTPWPSVAAATAPAALLEVLQTLPADALARLWPALDAVVDDTLTRHYFTEAAGGADGDEAARDSTSHVTLLQRAVALLHGYAEDAAAELPSAYWAAVQRLHAVLFYIPGDRENLALRSAVCRLAERLWVQKRPERATVISSTVAVLLLEALEDGAGDGVVKRLWAVRDCLDLFDWDEEENDSMREMLVQCFARPLFSRSADNRRVLSAILAQCPPLVADAAAVMRAQLPSQPERVHEGWGEVLYRAWAAADAGPARTAIEQSAIQDLMARGVGAAHPATFAAVRRVLSVFVARKTQRARGVEGMLLRLYAPVLFRALVAPNAALRKNAALLLLDAFPLRDTEGAAAAAAAAAEGGSTASTSGGDSVLQRQFTALTELLLDPCPGVREVGVVGVGRVLSNYWELVPPATSKALLLRLVDDCAHDAAAPAVRAAVPAALAELALAQPLSHPMLALPALLPATVDLLHDRSEKVRRPGAREGVWRARTSRGIIAPAHTETV